MVVPKSEKMQRQAETNKEQHGIMDTSKEMKGQIRVSFSTETASQVERFCFGRRVPLSVGLQRRTTAVCGG